MRHQTCRRASHSRSSTCVRSSVYGPTRRCRGAIRGETRRRCRKSEHSLPCSSLRLGGYLADVDCAVLSLPYYFSNIDRLFLPDYRPTEQDTVRSRAKTTGISETAFKIGELVSRSFASLVTSACLSPSDTLLLGLPELLDVRRRRAAVRKEEVDPVSRSSASRSSLVSPLGCNRLT